MLSFESFHFYYNSYYNNYIELCKSLEDNNIEEDKYLSDCQIKFLFDLSMTLRDFRKRYNKDQLRYLESSNVLNAMNITPNDFFATMFKIQNKLCNLCVLELNNSLFKIKSLTTNNCGVFKISNIKFNILMHKIRVLGGYGDNNGSLTKRILDDFNEWFNADGNCTISTSLIANDYFGQINGEGVCLGFSSIEESSIMGIAPFDLKVNDVKNYSEIVFKNSRFLPANLLIEDSKLGLFNEIILSRNLMNKSSERRKPDYIVSFGDANELELKASETFKVPIVQIDYYGYINAMRDNFYSLLSSCQNTNDTLLDNKIAQAFKAYENSLYFKDNISSEHKNEISKMKRKMFTI